MTTVVTYVHQMISPLVGAMCLCRLLYFYDS